MIQPKPGDDVLYHPIQYSNLVKYDQSPMVGKVVYAQHHDLVNLVVWDHAGNSRSMPGVELWQEGANPARARPEDNYCEFDTTSRVLSIDKNRPFRPYVTNPSNPAKAVE